MKIVIAAVGRIKSGPEKSLIESYRTRLPWSVDVREVDHKKDSSPQKTTQTETDSMIGLIPKGARIICLDSRGKSLDSAAFAKRIGHWRDDGEANLGFLIGGPDGLAKSALDASDLTLAFGTATWPHALARVLLLEQLYRAHCILTGHPYHRGH